MEGLPLSYLDIKSLSQWGPDLSGDLSCVHCTALSTHFSQNKMEQHLPSGRTKDLNIYSSFSYQTSWEIMNISANIRLNKSLETDGELAFSLFSVAYICWQMAAALSALSAAGHSDVYSNFYDIKNLSGSFGCVRVENKRTRIKITSHSWYKSSIFKTLSLWRCLYLFSLIQVLTVLMNNTKIISTPTRGQWLGHIHGLASNVKIR